MDGSENQSVASSELSALQGDEKAPARDSLGFAVDQSGADPKDFASEQPPLEVTRVFTAEQIMSASDDRLESSQLSERYQQFIDQNEVAWKLTFKLLERLGAGGQGVVFLAEREGAFGATFQLALKFYRPDGYPSVASYRKEMARMARVAMEVARIQHDHLLDVYNVVELDGIQVLVTEWVDGVDIRQLLTPSLLERVETVVDSDRWKYVNEVIVTRAGFQSRLKPGVAISILRECLSGLAALHREGFIHADMKPSNVMVKRTGNSKIIDLGSSFHVDELPSRPTWTPRYAAVEVLEGAGHSPLSDLASLGYVFFEMLTGSFPFAGCSDGPELVEAKRNMWKKLPTLLPKDVSRNATLVNLLSRMIAPDPADRFSSVEEADLSDKGAAEIERQLVKTGLSSEYDNEIRVLMEELQSIGAAD